MTISFPILVPDQAQIASVTFGMDGTTAVTESWATRDDQAFDWGGGRWRATVTLPPLDRADAEEWVGFLTSLRGRFGRFYLGDPQAATPLGEGGGTPLVAGASQTGYTLAIDGATISQTGWLLRGDWLQVGGGANRRLHKITADADTDVSGAVTLDIWPQLRESPADNTALVVDEPKGVFRLAANRFDWSVSEAVEYGITFAAVEAV